jgi:hypothetical protein
MFSIVLRNLRWNRTWVQVLTCDWQHNHLDLPYIYVHTAELKECNLHWYNSRTNTSTTNKLGKQDKAASFRTFIREVSGSNFDYPKLSFVWFSQSLLKGKWSFFFSAALQLFGPWPALQFHNLSYTDRTTPWTGDQPVSRPLSTHRTTQTQNTTNI